MGINKRIDELTEETSIAAGDYIAIADVSASNASRKVTRTNYLDNLSNLGNNSTARGNLGLGSIATQNANNVTITGGSLTDITDIAVADGGTGASDAPTARTNLGIGSIATQNSNNVSITGGSISGITDLAIADGGTGASTAATALQNLIRGWDGWIEAGETWTYASADDPTFTFTISGDLTLKYTAGMRVLLQQSSTFKYFIITKVAYSAPNTTVTIYGGTDYDLANATISTPYYSHMKAPRGFPLNPALWMVKATDTSSQSQASPVQNTWYNPGSLQISVPIGSWLLEYLVTHRGNGGSVISTLSTANNSESDSEFSALSAVTTNDINIPATRRKHIDVSSKTTYFLNIRTISTAVTSIAHRGDLATTIIRATCAYI